MISFTNSQVLYFESPSKLKTINGHCQWQLLNIKLVKATTNTKKANWRRHLTWTNYTPVNACDFSVFTERAIFCLSTPCFFCPAYYVTAQWGANCPVQHQRKFLQQAGVESCLIIVWYHIFSNSCCLWNMAKYFDIILHCVSNIILLSACSRWQWNSTNKMLSEWCEDSSRSSDQDTIL